MNSGNETLDNNAFPGLDMEQFNSSGEERFGEPHENVPIVDLESLNEVSSNIASDVFQF